MTLNHSRIKWFETRFRKLISKGLPSSHLQFQILIGFVRGTLGRSRYRGEKTTRSD